MDGHAFDRVTRQFAGRYSRRHVLRLFGLGAAATVLPTALGGQAASAASEASALVGQFYELVDAYQYADAYALLGTKWQGQQSQTDFTLGYTNTAFVQCATTGETTSNGKTVVGVKLISWHNDGAIVAYTGSYTVGMEHGKLTILAGDNKLTPVPANTPPLCAIADLAFGFGRWQGAAGNLIGSISAKNISTHTCVVGGSPRVVLTGTHGNTLVSTSQAGSAPAAIVLRAGERAAAPLRFGNWCGATGNPASVQVEVPGDLNHTGRISYRTNGISYPPCNGPTEPALLDIKGFQR